MDAGHGMGWLRDLPDHRDYHRAHESVTKLFAASTAKLARAAARGAGAADLGEWCSPVKDQAQLGSCTANAAGGMYEYFEKRATGQYLDASRLFIYWTTRKLMGLHGDSGASLRATMGSLVLFGSPPEKYWPYTDKSPDFDREPGAFHYAFAQSFQALTYYRLDPVGAAPSAFVDAVKKHIDNGYVSMLGFTVYDSYAQASTTGVLPYPAPKDRAVGGHAVLVVGYDDGMKIRNTNAGGAETTGALKIKNSWGRGWGANGFGWLPYAYLEKGLADDCWTMVKGEWLETGQFGLP